MRNTPNTLFTQNTLRYIFAEIAVCASDKSENGKVKSENGKVKGERNSSVATRQLPYEQGR